MDCGKADLSEQLFYTGCQTCFSFIREKSWIEE
jgi:hypothetical protein